jgi:hypothetical protein
MAEQATSTANLIAPV